MDGRRLGLGIDVGGAFIDAAVVDLDDRDVLAKAKCSTIFKDTATSLTDLLFRLTSNIDLDLTSIRMVGLSTTLATNSIIEKSGGTVGLVGIGWERQKGWELGADKEAFVAGGHDVKGKEVFPLDFDSLVDAVEEMNGVDAFVVSSKFSVYNPGHEEKARELIREMVDRPVVLGHELTGELGILERTVTAVLNAKLLPLTDDYLSRISDVLSSFGITAQVMVLKGDGHLMNLESARRRPVETILSGPAASVIGGGALSGHQDCLVVDIGSTSTDIAFLDKGSPRLNRYGAAVGSWRTRVQAIDVWTAGLGGDSMIDVDFYGNIRIGPERAIPLAITGRKYPELKRKMVELDAIDLLVLSSRGCDHLCKNERRVLKFIKEHGPSTLEEVAEGLIDLHFPKELVCELVQKRCLMVTGLTPTDVFHHRGLYSWGDLEASTEGISIAAARSRMDVDHFVERFMEKMTSRIAEEVLRKLYVDGTGEMLKAHEGDQLVSLLVGERKLCSTDLRLELDRPVVGLGAIADILVPTLESRFGARTFIPEHHEVGNAIGSVLSKVSETVKVQVMPTREGDYEIISSYIRYPIWDVNEALNRAKELASDLARIRAIEAGGTNVRISIDVEEKTFQSGFSGDLTNWIEVTAVAVGEPKGLG